MNPIRVKRSLDSCAHDDCTTCPYSNLRTIEECTALMAREALEYIEQLEKRSGDKC